MMRTLLFILLIAFAGAELNAQDALTPRKSPLSTLTYAHDDAFIKVTYGRPHKRDRVVFGPDGIVPYGKLWRTGANEATEITLEKDAKINGEAVPAGTYSLFTIPGEKEWTIVLSKDRGLWGAFDYNEENDLLRFKVKSAKSEILYEPFTIKFITDGNDVDLVMLWDETKVAFDIQL